MPRLETYKMLSKKVNRYIQMINKCRIVNNKDIALWNCNVISSIINDYYRLGKITFVAKIYFENRIDYNAKWIGEVE